MTEGDPAEAENGKRQGRRAERATEEGAPESDGPTRADADEPSPPAPQAEGDAAAAAESEEGEAEKRNFSFDNDESLQQESAIQVTPYDVFLEGHGRRPGQTPRAEPEPEPEPEAQPQPAVAVDAEPGPAEGEWQALAIDGDGSEDADLSGAGAPDQAVDAASIDGEAAQEEAVDLREHRFGLRLGSHGEGNFMQKLRARFKKDEVPVDLEALRQQEFEEARAERIEPDERYKEVETYPIRPPYGEVRILFDDETKEYIYQPLEPILTKTEREILSFIEETLVDTLTVTPDSLGDIDERAFITDRFNDVIFDYSIILHEDEEQEDEIKRRLLYYVLRDFIGFGHIDLIMDDPYIEDVSCDGPHVPIFLYHRKYESVRSTVVYGEHDILDAFVIKMAQRSGKHISIAEPILDATLPDGSRLQSTLGKEVSAGGSTYTIRKFRPDPFTPPDLVLFRTMSAEMLAYLWIAVQHGSSILYSGGTASGKTTSLNAILLFIPPQMKIVSIEDTREVNLPHENWIAGITRHGFGPRDQFGRQAGEIDMFQLLKNALRQRPEYIIVGEVRGQEAYSLFQAMATGHAAYGTMHADSVDAVIHRLESDPINIPRNLLEALDVVSVQIQTRVGGKRVRRTKQISEIVGIDPHTREILTNEVFRWVPKNDSFKFSGISYILERIQLEKALPEGSMVRELHRRALMINWMIEKRIQDYREVSKIVSAYYREPEVVMALVQGHLAEDEIPSGLREIAQRTTEDAQDGNLLSAAALEQAKVVLGTDPDSAPAEATPPQAEDADPDGPDNAPEEIEPLAAEAAHADAPPAASAARGARARPDLSAAKGWGAQQDASEQEDEEPPVPVAEAPQRDAPWGGAAALLDAVQEAAAQEASGQPAESQKAEPIQAEPQQAEPQQAEPQQAEPQQAEPQQAEPQQAEPQQAEPQQAEPQQAEPQHPEPQPAEPQAASTASLEDRVDEALSARSRPQGTNESADQWLARMEREARDEREARERRAAEKRERARKHGGSRGRRGRRKGA